MGKRKTIFFIGDLLTNKSNDETFEINSKMIFRKATDIECNLIREDLKSHFGVSLFEKDFNPYENDYIITKKNKHQVNSNYKPRNINSWYYWVVESHTNIVGGIENYLPLSVSDFHVLCGYEYSVDGIDPSTDLILKFQNNNINASVFYSNLRHCNYTPKLIDKSIVDNIKSILDIVDNFNTQYSEEYFEIKKALDDFLKLGQIPVNNPFFVLNCFSILEQLLTTKQETSITHQLKTKINLINNRLDNKINLTRYFKSDPKLETIVAALYSMRSNIAHGSFKDFKDFKIGVKDEPIATIPDFVYNELIKKMLIQAIREPKLISDLRNC